MQKYVIIAAGGVGSRMQLELPKQFILIHMKPVICYTIEKFVEAFADIEVIITVPENYMELTKAITQQYFPNVKIKIVVGGSTRFHSVKNGLNAIQNDDGIVFIHDAARCLITKELINHCYVHTVKNGNAIPCITPTDSLRIIDEDNSIILNRNLVRCMQTPQTFFVQGIKKGFEQEYKESFTDEASVLENIGIKLNLIQGDAQNIKLTSPFDLAIATYIIGKYLEKETN
jgi:2-C-methyl-D-erythritol 4-phosphate cytidylyltransferase